MHLVRFYLPLHDNTGAAFPAQMLADVSSELSDRFGGVTAHLLSPASGLWRDGGDMHADDVVIFEVFTQNVDRGWWTAYRGRLAEDFRQKSILMLLQPVEVI